VRLGVVIPARDEEETIGPCLLSTRPFILAGDDVVVVDDGSKDGTCRVAEAARVRTLSSPRRGRGYAVATGVAEVRSSCEGIVLLHADMTVPPDARSAIVRVLQGAPAGFLGHRIADPRLRFRLVEWGNRFRARVWRLPYGDQGQFFRTSILDAIGGFPDQERLEDLELALRLRGVGTVVDAGTPVTIPARHWERGIVRVFFRNTATVARYRLARS
jgi:glycosyltransferase involved in cell wall biosynthesis